MIKIADGLDVLPLVMAMQRQGVMFAENSEVVLFDGTWTGEFFAFPQLREMLLNVMRRVECGKVVSVSILAGQEEHTIPVLLDAQVNITLIVLSPMKLVDNVVRPGDVLWLSGAEEIVCENASFVKVQFEAMP